MAWGAGDAVQRTSVHELHVMQLATRQAAHLPALTLAGAHARTHARAQGMVFKRDAEGSVKEVSDGKVVVYAQGVDTTGTETKGTVLIKSAEELENYSRWVG